MAEGVGELTVGHVRAARADRVVPRPSERARPAAARRTGRPGVGGRVQAARLRAARARRPRSSASRRNVSRDAHRRRVRPVEDAIPPTASRASQFEASILQRGLDVPPEDERVAPAFSARSGPSYTEMAQATGSTVPAVRSRIERARRLCAPDSCHRRGRRSFPCEASDDDDDAGAAPALIDRERVPHALARALDDTEARRASSRSPPCGTGSTRRRRARPSGSRRSRSTAPVTPRRIAGVSSLPPRCWSPGSARRRRRAVRRSSVHRADARRPVHPMSTNRP